MRCSTRSLAEFQSLEEIRLEELPQVEYAKVEQVLKSNDRVFRNTDDFDIRMDLCNNAIAAITEYQKKHSEGEWYNIAKASLANWQQRLKETRESKTRLLDELHATLKSKSENAAKKQHPLSKIEECILAGSEEFKKGADLCITDTYEIRMRGNILGHSIFKLIANATGCIVAATQTVVSEKDVTLIE